MVARTCRLPRLFRYSTPCNTFTGVLPLCPCTSICCETSGGRVCVFATRVCTACRRAHVAPRSAMHFFPLFYANTRTFVSLFLFCFFYIYSRLLKKYERGEQVDVCLLSAHVCLHFKNISIRIVFPRNLQI